MYGGIRIRPSNYTVIYTTCKIESCWRRGENAVFPITWGDVSRHLLFSIIFDPVLDSFLGDLIFAKCSKTIDVFNAFEPEHFFKKNHSKTLRRASKKLPRGLRTPPRCFQEGPRASKSLPRVFFSTPRASKSAPRGFQEAFLAPSASMLRFGPRSDPVLFPKGKPLDVTNQRIS